MRTHRHTKIVATVGPATASPEGIRILLDAGVNVFRLNMAHGEHETHRQVAGWIREFSDIRPIGILADLAGPKIRIGALGSPRQLVEGDEVVIAPEGDADKGELPCTYDALALDVSEGDRILLDDGLLEFRVLGTDGERVRAVVVTGGLLKANKGLNLPGVRVSAPALTDKDRRDLDVALEIGADFIGLSFVRKPGDVHELRGIIGERPDAPQIVAKIEKDTALEQLDEVVLAADCVMVARGDLGVELPFQDVPAAQKRIVERALFHARPVITATQMLESMIENVRPTRAEANDVATAVYDSSDAVMLSGETAVGKHPRKAVRAMRDIIRAVEDSFEQGRRASTARAIERRQTAGGTRTEHAVAAATVDSVRMLEAPAIVTLTHSGFSARLVSSYRPCVPVVAVTHQRHVAQRLSLVWGVRVVVCKEGEDNERRIQRALDHIAAGELGEAGQRVVVTSGLPPGRSRTTNMFHVVEL